MTSVILFTVSLTYLTASSKFISVSDILTAILAKSADDYTA